MDFHLESTGLHPDRMYFLDDVKKKFGFTNARAFFRHLTNLGIPILNFGAEKLVRGRDLWNAFDSQG